MAKLSAAVNKKVPIPGVNYSSQMFEAHLEIEIDEQDARDRSKVLSLLSGLHEQLIEAVDAQIALAHAQTVRETDPDNPW